jgi:hypothetical protein
MLSGKWDLLNKSDHGKLIEHILEQFMTFNH